MALLSGDVFHIHQGAVDKTNTGERGGGAFGNERHAVFIILNSHFAKYQLWRQGTAGAFFAIPVGETAS